MQVSTSPLDQIARRLDDGEVAAHVGTVLALEDARIAHDMSGVRDIEIKRIYDEPEARDGYRVLVDRLWPRGITKERAHLNEWAKDVAPSTELRKWFSHDPARMQEFRKRYVHELHAAHPPELAALAKTSEKTRVTLLYAAHDPQINHAVVLKEVVQGLK